ncbi:MAG: TonB family protein [Candidatus Sulfotelmatobacter sp.]
MRLTATILIILASLYAGATDVKVIANSSIRTDTISSSEIKRIFLLEANSLGDGTHVEPVLRRSGSAHEAFLKEFLDTDDNTLHVYYGTLVFTGKAAMPKELDSDADIVKYVARTKGAIGYVSADTVAWGVKTLAIAELGSSAQRILIRQVKPVYPEALKERNIGGTVRLQVTISAGGGVDEITLLGGNPILADSAIYAVKQWVYSRSRSRTTIEISLLFQADP